VPRSAGVSRSPGPRIALVGCGRWGRHVLRDLVGLGCEVPVVARREETRRTAEEGGAAAVVGAIAELPQVEGAVVVTPTTTHAEVVDELLGMEIPLFVEKPLTDDAASARRLAEAAPERLFVMHKWRYHHGIELMARIAREGRLGGVVGLRTTRLGWGNPHGDVDGVWMLAPHDISIVLEVLGEIPEPASAVVERADSLVTGMVGTLGRAPWATIEVSIAHPVRRREVRLVCEEGVAVLPDAYSDRVLVARGELQRQVSKQEEEHRISGELPLLRELRAFVEHVQGGPPPRSSAAEGAAEVAAIARLRELAGA
jgi:predicted dehydrogenase